ncbi:glycosyltransferase family A protein [Cellulophaga omnivescoria]|uniref:glycosyltransferase family A protein n=1 Tax=Cellulophaga omnivescoria TaxID=1888890 RepID=UPI0009869613|nr:glycosyltransferase family A protein [Cellulophaga omnivescoria]WBU88808.1 glycosyltransferase family A protein [Cellulophaga omnivescoria]
MRSKNTPIVVVAYNRPKSLQRLLTSLSKADYPNTDIDLIISIDNGSDNDSVLNVANNFNWDFGNKKVEYQQVNLGLRKHIIQCGDLSTVYGSVIVLEDDLLISPNFYNYTVSALDFSKDKQYVAGISLYNHQFNVHKGEHFNAIDDGYDNWYFQFASSWGQAWSADHWRDFKNWYNKGQDIANNTKVPKYVRSWSEKSWLKYNIAYLVEKNLFFLYPKVSLSTNFSDAGTHVGIGSNLYQVSLQLGLKKKYFFSELKDSKSVYDAFFENNYLKKYFYDYDTDTTIDLYGYKNVYSSNYLLTNKIINYKIEKSFGKFLKPLDSNIINDINGDDFFLYNLSVSQKNDKVLNFKKEFLYNIKRLNYNDAVHYIKLETFRKFRVLLRRILGK